MLDGKVQNVFNKFALTGYSLPVRVRVVFFPHFLRIKQKSSY